MKQAERKKLREGRRAYVKPRLTDFGRVADLTRAVAMAGNADGGIVLLTKT